jgi:hypothetical protein
MRLPPFRQGALDGICGLYSIVNADRIVNGSTTEQSLQLYNELLTWLSRHGMLQGAMVEGLMSDELRLILQKAAGKRFGTIEVPWRGVTTPTLDEFWRSMQDFMGKGRAIILGLNGRHDHWTVVRDITRRSIWLYDSDGMGRLTRHDCSTSKSQRKHFLRPAQTYYLAA